MTDFDPRFFQKYAVSDQLLDAHLRNALRDLGIARTSTTPEVKFTFTYNALIKAGITLLAKLGAVRVRSVSGHHVQLLLKMAELLDDQEVADIGNAMRTKRNLDFYGSGQVITGKEAEDYFKFVDRVVREIEPRVRS